MKRFFHKKRNISFLLLGVVLLPLFSWFVVSFPPDSLLHFILFYVLLFGLSMTLCIYVFADMLQASIISISIIIYFLLRSFNLRHPLYLFLLFICSISVYRLFSQPPSTPKNG